MNNRTILVIDDEEPIVMSVKLALGKKYNIEAATDAQAAFKYLSENKADLILLDINMPVMNGMEVLEEIRSRYADVNVIMMTAYATDENIQKAETLGVCGFIFKPFNVADLRSCVDRLLSEKNGRK